MFPRLQNLALLLLVLLVFILRFPSFFEPYWYGDELIRLIVAREWFAGKALYGQIFDNSPPLLYLIFGIAKSIVALKILAAIWVVAAVTIFYFLAQDFAKNAKLPKVYSYLATAIFIFLTSTPILEGNLASAEIFALTPALAGIYCVWRAKSITYISQIVLAGIFLAAATLTRIQAVTDLVTAGLFLLILGNFKSFFVLLQTFILVWLLMFLVFITTSNWQGFYNSVFLGNFDYVGFTNQLIIPFGLIGLKILGLILALSILSKAQKFLTNVNFLIILWLILSFFGAAISGRGYTHYFLQAAPPVSLLLAQIARFKLGNLGQFAGIFSIIAVFLILAILHSRPFSYYKNFLNFFYDYPAYVDWFDPRVTQSAQIANYVTAKTTPDDKILVLGNAPEIYLMSKRRPSGKYVVSYHLNFQKAARAETLENFSKSQPKIVVVDAEGKGDLPALYELLPVTYQLTAQIGKGEIWERGF